MVLNILRPYIVSFLLVFIAMDITIKLPLFLALKESLSHKQNKKVIIESMVFALGLVILFVLVGHYFLLAIGATEADINIAGGILILVLSIIFLVSSEKITPLEHNKHLHGLGMFPYTSTLIAGPILLTISLVNSYTFGIPASIIALILNMFPVWLMLEKSEIINRLIGAKGLKSFSKVFKIILSIIAVMLIRQGIIAIIIGQ